MTVAVRRCRSSRSRYLYHDRGSVAGFVRNGNARPTAIRTASVQVGWPAMVSYPSCSRWYRTHQWNCSATWILLVGVGLNPRDWVTVGRSREPRGHMLSSGSTGAHCRWARMAGDRCHQTCAWSRSAPPQGPPWASSDTPDWTRTLTFAEFLRTSRDAVVLFCATPLRSA